jgi:hypothetical protein
LSTTAKRYALGSSRPRPFVASRTSWTYQWTGTWGSCRWDAAGMDGEVRVDYHGLVAGRPVAYISGSPPSVVVPCNDTIWGNSPVWRFNYKGQAAIEPLFNWFEIDDERGRHLLAGLQQLQTAAGELIRGPRALAPLIQLLADETAARQARSGE